MWPQERESFFLFIYSSSSKKVSHIQVCRLSFGSYMLLRTTWDSLSLLNKRVEHLRRERKITAKSFRALRKNVSVEFLEVSWCVCLLYEKQVSFFRNKPSWLRNVGSCTCFARRMNSRYWQNGHKWHNFISKARHQSVRSHSRHDLLSVD